MRPSMEELTLFCQRVKTAMQWRLDVAKGEMIEQRLAGHDKYTKNYLSYASEVSQEDLDKICFSVNKMFELADSDLMIANSMGEIIPSKRLH